MCWALAVVLYRVGTPGSVARKLALLLVVEGVTLVSSGSTEYFLTSPVAAYRLHPELLHAELFVHTLGDCAMLTLYPPFLAAALNTTLTRPFADQRVQIGLAAVAIVLFVAVPLIAYGILRTQLFDIDLRIRWTIKQSTLAAAVVFFMTPLQRFAERVASTAMPNTQNTPEYAAHRKLQAYEAAVAEALQGGGVSQKERALLTRLRDSLGVAPADAETLERELGARSPSGGAPIAVR